ncbi:MAG: hypothetical protein EA412_06095 [Chitinophagaceae bacterium]|nr:MAG: hypothetical protein EA412_06095 [Chitinophagaceae bacterium]
MPIIFPKVGDICFQSISNDEMDNAILETTSTKSFPFNHVGIFLGNAILESTPSKGVVKTAWEDFLEKSFFKGNHHTVICRIKNTSKSFSEELNKNAKKYLGKKYNFAFFSDKKTFYCSELVSDIVNESLGREVFKTINMTFKTESGKTHPFWLDYFKKLKAPIPEGHPGTNPADMFKNKELEIIADFRTEK